MILHYSPGAVSMAAHILLRELGLDFELRAYPTGDDAHLTPAYLALNPMGRVPTLEVDGRTLTEMPAILIHLGRGTAWLPTEGWARARCDELLSQIASLAHPPYRMAMRPDRILGPSGDEAAQRAVREAGRREFLRVIQIIDGQLPETGPAVGLNRSVADPYLAVIWLWVRYLGESTRPYPRLSRIAVEMLRRPAAQHVMVAEGLVDAEGQPTPPTRV
ncbi:MAG: glutathione S-transferase family protein [Myxococcota bacterium]